MVITQRLSVTIYWQDNKRPQSRSQALNVHGLKLPLGLARAYRIKSKTSMNRYLVTEVIEQVG